MLKKILCAAGAVLLMAAAGAGAAEYDAGLVAAMKADAERGNAMAQAGMGECHAISGLCEGVPQDFAKAREWWEKAAAQGNADAQHRLGLLYYEGYGVRQDYARAQEWFEKAAAQGYAQAQCNLGLLYANGHGVRQDNATAKEWFGKACQNGSQQGCGEYRKLNEAGF